MTFDPLWRRLEPLRAGPLRRIDPSRPGAFTANLHDRRTVAFTGTALGVAVLICFATGLYSHALQQPPSWWDPPARPVSLYRWTQGLHVATGLATVPLLLAKLYTVYPRLFEWPPARDVPHALERLSILVLLSTLFLEIVTGLFNIAQWYVFPFGFLQTHWSLAWVAVGAMLLHLAVKAPLIVQAYSRAGEPVPNGPERAGMSRRAFVLTIGAAVATLTTVTIGQTVTPLRRLALLAPRDPAIGPQGLPVNRSAVEAAVVDLALDPAYTLLLRGPDGERRLSLADLRALPRHTATLPIACVEGWSAEGRWSGVRLADLTALVGAPAGARVSIVSLEPAGPYRTSEVGPDQAADPLTLLALDLNGAELDIDHGYPCRLIGPGRPGVLQTKWVAEVLAR